MAVEAFADMGARPSVKHPRMATGSTDLAEFMNFIKMTPGKIFSFGTADVIIAF
jgi:hypothetical protein